MNLIWRGDKANFPVRDRSGKAWPATSPGAPARPLRSARERRHLGRGQELDLAPGEPGRGILVG
ncbi:hypothetical protein ACOY96_24100, partial [Enterobacter asburiae]